MSERMTAEKAMDDCVAAINNGAALFGFSIDLDLLKELQERFADRFKELFKEDPDIWNKLGATVTKMARYLGAVAALNADSKQNAAVEGGHLFEAARLIQQKCPADRATDQVLKAACGGVDLSDPQAASKTS